MRLTDAVSLLDTNVLLALTDDRHGQHEMTTRWFMQGAKSSWSTCAFTQAGFIRLRSNPKLGSYSIREASEVLRLFTNHPGHRFWPIGSGWLSAFARFGDRIVGHQQVTDAYLLGLAVERDGVLVTMDRGVVYLAGDKYRGNVLLLR